MDPRPCRDCHVSVGLSAPSVATFDPESDAARLGGLCKVCGRYTCDEHGWMLHGEGDWFHHDCRPRHTYLFEDTYRSASADSRVFPLAGADDDTDPEVRELRAEVARLRALATDIIDALEHDEVSRLPEFRARLLPPD